MIARSGGGFKKDQEGRVSAFNFDYKMLLNYQRRGIIHGRPSGPGS